MHNAATPLMQCSFDKNRWNGCLWFLGQTEERRIVSEPLKIHTHTPAVVLQRLSGIL